MTVIDISMAIRCRRCGKAGIAIWRERQDSDPINCDAVKLSDGFRPNGRDDASGDTQIICEQCGAIVPS